MDNLMERRREIILAMASANKVKTGTFIGNGTINATLNIGFEPDVLVVYRDSSTLTVGIQNIVFLRGRSTYNSICYTVGGNLTAQGYSTFIFENQDIWGHDTSEAYRSYATFADGIIEISNITNAGRCYLINGEQYIWMAYKL